MIYSPREDSFLLAKYVKKYAKGKVLDMGCGSGIQTLAALKKARDVLAVDVDMDAVKLCKSKDINARQSNLFENVNGKFNLIIFNPPYLPEDKREYDRATTGGKHGYELIERFLSEAKNYLNKNGKILIICSSLTGDVKKLFRKYNYHFRCLEEKKLFFEKLFVFVLEAGS